MKIYGAVFKKKGVNYANFLTIKCQKSKKVGKVQMRPKSGMPTGCRMVAESCDLVSWTQ